MRLKHKKNLLSRWASNKGKKEQPILDLLNLMAWLRSPAGCPWDRAQTEDSLKNFLLEESYEVLEAIEENDSEMLQEELGDLLLQIIFISRIAEEKGEFNFFDVVRSLTAKLLRRHPHVFPPEKNRRNKINIPDAPAVVKLWQELKKREKTPSSTSSILNGLPLSLPALERAQRLSQKAAQVGFDWPNIKELWKKVREEMKELRRAEKTSSSERIKEEFGDLLFTLTNLARFQGFSAEEALRQAIGRFVRRFREMEYEIKKKRKKWTDFTLAELDELWNKIKKREK